MGDEDCILFARLGVRDGQLKTGVQADQDAAFSLAQAAAEELKRDNRLRVSRVRRASISRVYPATTRTAFSSLEELADRCRLAAKICLASAIGFPVDSEWGQNLNRISPKVTIVQSEDNDEDDDDEGDKSLLDEEESEACLQKCDSIFKDLASRLKEARSPRLTVSATFAVYQWKEFAEITATIRFRRRSSLDGNGDVWSSSGVICTATVASVLRRSRCHEEGTAVMNLKNHCYDVGKEFMPHEESDLEYNGDMDSASQSEESDVDEDDGGFVPVAQDILDLVHEAENDEAQSTDSSESDLES